VDARDRPSKQPRRPRPEKRTADLRLEVAGGAPAVTAARRAIAGLEPYLDVESTQAVLLLVSELVTNAILHGGADAANALKLGLSVSGQTIRVTVQDPGGGFPLEPVSEPDREGGWGLVLLEQLADRWGIEDDPDHMIWFEIDRPAARTSRP
jgi:two-component sensor histidine kinase